MRNIRDYIDLIETTQKAPETRVSVRVQSYEANPAQAVDTTAVPRTFVITFDGEIPEDQIEQIVRDEVLKITGFKPDRMSWKRTD